MSAEQRREQLLDTAGELLVEGGFDAVTMEAVGQRAGASKTLGYAYFENVNDVLWSLYEREVKNLIPRIRAAVDDASNGFEHRLRAAVHSYFDDVVENGVLLNMLAAGVIAGQLTPQGPSQYDEFHRYFGRLIDDEFGVGKARSLAYAAMLSGIAFGHAAMLSSSRSRRGRIENDCIAFFLAGLRAVSV